MWRRQRMRSGRSPSLPMQGGLRTKPTSRWPRPRPPQHARSKHWRPWRRCEPRSTRATRPLPQRLVAGALFEWTRPRQRPRHCSAPKARGRSSNSAALAVMHTCNQLLAHSRARAALPCLTVAVGHLQSPSPPRHCARRATAASSRPQGPLPDRPGTAHAQRPAWLRLRSLPQPPRCSHLRARSALPALPPSRLALASTPPCPRRNTKGPRCMIPTTRRR